MDVKKPGEPYQVNRVKISSYFLTSPDSPGYPETK
ncbi:hypothetical protein LTSEMIS_2910, partial [Salmonella enterica subsp. enterica serovar Mississippi str. A4-633]